MPPSNKAAPRGWQRWQCPAPAPGPALTHQREGVAYCPAHEHHKGDGKDSNLDGGAHRHTQAATGTEACAHAAGEFVGEGGNQREEEGGCLFGMQAELRWCVEGTELRLPCGTVAANERAGAHPATANQTLAAPPNPLSRHPSAPPEVHLILHRHNHSGDVFACIARDGQHNEAHKRLAEPCGFAELLNRAGQVPMTKERWRTKERILSSGLRGVVCVWWRLGLLFSFSGRL